jgi:hypothetical protein
MDVIQAAAEAAALLPPLLPAILDGGAKEIGKTAVAATLAKGNIDIQQQTHPTPYIRQPIDFLHYCPSPQNRGTRIKARVDRASTVHADETAGRNSLRALPT